MAKLHHYWGSLRTSAASVVTSKRLHHYYADLTTAQSPRRLHHYYADLTSKAAPKRVHHYYASLSTSKPSGSQFWFHNGAWRARSTWRFTNGQWASIGPYIPPPVQSLYSDVYTYTEGG
jgi:hypothetical protein